MRRFLLVILLCFFMPVFAQGMDYTEIDKYAHDAPPLRTRSGLDRLVHYLVRPYRGEEERARVILAWIVHNIDYDDYKFNAIEDDYDKTKKKKDKELYVSDNDILETRVGVCEDIADLYKKMGKLAGLTVEVVRGKAGKGMTFADFENSAGHTWNVVKINNEWEYVDPTWAIDGADVRNLGDIKKKKEYKQVIKERSKKQSDAKLPREGRFVNNQWFLTDKDEMIKTHFPNDEKWQLQDKKIKKEDFLNLDKKSYNEAKREYRKSLREKK